MAPPPPLVKASYLYLVSVCLFSCTPLFVSISQDIGCEDRLRNDLYCVEKRWISSISMWRDYFVVYSESSFRLWADGRCGDGRSSSQMDNCAWSSLLSDYLSPCCSVSVEAYDLQVATVWISLCVAISASILHKHDFFVSWKLSLASCCIICIFFL